MSDHGPIDEQFEAIGAQQEEDFAQGFAVRCLGFVDDYRQGRRSKAEVTRELVAVSNGEYARDNNVPRDILDRALGDYLGMLDDFDRERDAALLGGHRANQNDERHQDEEERADPLVRPPVRGRAEDAEGEGPRKRRAIDAILPFNVDQRAGLPEDLTRTLETLDVFANDPAYVKAKVLKSASRPEFPGTLWGDIIANSFVDLDRIFDFHYTMEGEAKRLIHRIGDLQLVSDSTKVDKHVRTSGDWTIAWAKYKAAVLFLFPHRQYELDKYGAHVESSFLSNPLTHDRVLKYDKRVRTRAADSGRLRLCDTGEFFADYHYLVINAAHGTRATTTSGLDRPGLHHASAPTKSAVDSTSRRAGTPGVADISMHVFNAGGAATSSTSAQTGAKAQTVDQQNAIKYPRFTRGFLWDVSSDSGYLTPSASATEHAPPLPSPPAAILEHPDTVYPDLFKVVTPINIPRFASLLESHPNRPFVDSVIRGLFEGFWPPADDDPALYPPERDFPERPLSPASREFCQAQCDEEQRLGRFSEPFSSTSDPLLPGMISVPVHTVLKKSGKLRLVVDHSAGDFSPNSHIYREDVHNDLDTVHHLAHNLLVFRAAYGRSPRWLFKSDVSQAYRRLPMHPAWQMRQVVIVNGERRVDRCNNFGGRASAMIWCAFMSLVLWIAIFRLSIEALLAYMDDNFGHDDSAVLVLYKPYNALFPRKQALLLWDFIGLPHERDKQEFGSSLVITGFLVDATSLSITLDSDRQEALVLAVREFVTPQGGGQRSRRRTLREWMRILGWMSWALSVCPLLRPALSPGYAKISGKSLLNAPIFLNADVTRSFLWFADTFAAFSGIRLLRAAFWPPCDAELALYCDASLSGLAFWAPSLLWGFYYPLPRTPSGGETIFWLEALAVASALDFAASLDPPPTRLAIFTDNLDTVQMFDSLKASTPYNPILLFSCGILITRSIDLRVFHIPGDRNTVADALSRGLVRVALDAQPRLRVFRFQPPPLRPGHLEPPHLTLGCAPRC